MNNNENSGTDYMMKTEGGNIVLEHNEPRRALPLRALAYKPLILKDKNKAKSSILRFFLENSNLSIEALAEYLGCQTQSLRNKLARNTVSLDDLIIAAYACDYSVMLRNDKTGEDFTINVSDYFAADKTTQTKLEALKSQADISYKRQEYERLKAYVSEMEKKYGFGKSEK